MGLIFNGTSMDQVFFNGQQINEVIFNGVSVWPFEKKFGGSYPVSFDVPYSGTNVYEEDSFFWFGPDAYWTGSPIGYFEPNKGTRITYTDSNGAAHTITLPATIPGNSCDISLKLGYQSVGGGGLDPDLHQAYGLIMQPINTANPAGSGRLAYSASFTIIQVEQDCRAAEYNSYVAGD